MLFLRRKKSKAELVKERVYDLTETLADRAVDLSGKAAVALAPRVETARDAAAAAYEQASTRVREDIAPRMRDDLAPRVRDDAARMRAAAAPAMAAVLRRPEVVEEPQKSHRLRNLLMLVGIGGLVAYAARKFGSGSSEPWASSGGDTSPSGTTYAGSATETAPARPTAVPDARDAADPLQGGDAAAAGATFAVGEAELDGDLADEFHEDSGGGR